MGREALCHCTWAGESANCKVLLETHELVLRGSLKKQVPIASLMHIAVHGDALTFYAGEEEVALHLGEKQAQSWAKKLAVPPVTLSAKLGITTQSKLLLLGKSESEALSEALSQAATMSARTPEQIIVCAHTIAELEQALSRATAFAAAPPIWVIYRKGSRSELPEAAVRDALRSRKYIDVKVASVDAAYTGLRFIARA